MDKLEHISPHKLSIFSPTSKKNYYLSKKRYTLNKKQPLLLPAKYTQYSNKIILKKDSNILDISANIKEEIINTSNECVSFIIEEANKDLKKAEDFYLKNNFEEALKIINIKSNNTLDSKTNIEHIDKNLISNNTLYKVHENQNKINSDNNQNNLINSVKHKDDFDLLYLKGQIYLNKKYSKYSLNSALSIFTYLETLQQHKFSLKYIIGTIYYNLKQYNLSIPYFRDALSIDNSNLRTKINLIISLLQNNSINEAYEECMDALKYINFNNLSINYENKKHNTQKDCSSSDTTSSINNNSIDYNRSSYINIKKTNYKIDEYNFSNNDLNTTAKIKSKENLNNSRQISLEILNLAAYFENRFKNYEKSLFYLNKANYVKENDTKVISNIIKIKIKLHNYQSAYNWVNLLIKLDENNIETIKLYMIISMKLFRWNDLEASSLKVLSLQKHNMIALNCLQYSLEKQEKFDELEGLLHSILNKLINSKKGFNVLTKNKLELKLKNKISKINNEREYRKTLIEHKELSEESVEDSESNTSNNDNNYVNISKNKLSENNINSKNTTMKINYSVLNINKDICKSFKTSITNKSNYLKSIKVNFDILKHNKRYGLNKIKDLEVLLKNDKNNASLVYTLANLYKEMIFKFNEDKINFNDKKIENGKNNKDHIKKKSSILHNNLLNFNNSKVLKDILFYSNKAINLFNELIKLNHNYSIADIYEKIGDCYYNSKKLKDAIEYYNKSKTIIEEELKLINKEDIITKNTLLKANYPMFFKLGNCYEIIYLDYLNNKDVDENKIKSIDMLKKALNFYYNSLLIDNENVLSNFHYGCCLIYKLEYEYKICISQSYFLDSDKSYFDNEEYLNINNSLEFNYNSYHYSSNFLNEPKVKNKKLIEDEEKNNNNNNNNNSNNSPSIIKKYSDVKDLKSNSSLKEEVKNNKDIEDKTISPYKCLLNDLNSKKDIESKNYSYFNNLTSYKEKRKYAVKFIKYSWDKDINKNNSSIFSKLIKEFACLKYYNDVINLYNKYKNKFMFLIEVVLIVSKCYEKINKIENAIMLLEEANHFSEFNGNSNYQCYLGILYERIKDFNKASSIYKSILVTNPEHFNTLINFGKLLLDAHEYKRSLKYLKYAYKTSVNNYNNLNYNNINEDNNNLIEFKFKVSLCLYLLGKLYYLTNNIKLAVISLKDCLLYEKYYIPAYYLLGDIFSDIENYEYNNLEIENSNNDDKNNEFYIKHFNSYTNIVSTKSNNSKKISYGIAKDYYNKAISCYSEINNSNYLRKNKIILEQINRAYEYSLIGLGNIYYQELNINEALFYHEKAYNLNSSSLRILIPYSSSLIACKEFNKAEEILKIIVDRDIDIPEIHLNLGNLYYYTKKIDEAIKQYKLAKNISERHKLELYHNLGSAYFLSKKYKDSIKCFKKSLQLNYTNVETHFNLANCYIFQNNYVKAKFHFKECINRDYASKEVLLGLVKCVIKLKDSNEYKLAENLINKLINYKNCKNDTSPKNKVINENNQNTTINNQKNYKNNIVSRNYLNNSTDSKVTKDIVTFSNEAIIIDSLREGKLSFNEELAQLKDDLNLLKI